MYSVYEFNWSSPEKLATNARGFAVSPTGSSHSCFPLRLQTLIWLIPRKCSIDYQRRVYNDESMAYIVRVTHCRCSVLLHPLLRNLQQVTLLQIVENVTDMLHLHESALITPLRLNSYSFMSNLRLPRFLVRVSILCANVNRSLQTLVLKWNAKCLYIVYF